MRRAIGLLVVALLFAAAPVVGAKGSKIKLKGVVVGHTVSGRGSFTIVSVRMGSKKVGKLSIGSSSCAGLECNSPGTANLKIGKVKGKATLSLHFKGRGGTACLIGTKGACKPAKYGTGKISNASGNEAIRVNTGNPSKVPKGGHFGVVLG